MSLHIRILLRRLRRRMARSEWLVRLLRLPRCEGTAHEPGLVVIQIDGLSRRQLERSLAKGRMPFLRGLLRHRGHRLHTLRTCVPSSTPAVQGELFYGVRQAVPAFSFFDRDAGRVRRMYEAESAEAVERVLEQEGEPLLRGGSAYSCIYSGGADETHWCISGLALKNAMHTSPSSLLLMLALHLFSVVRSAALIVVELGVAIVDFFRGITRGRDLWKELKFVPARVLICVLLREFITIGAKIDTARGLPIIYANFLGYDEQAHRRGPSSRFAHWTLKGIDDAIQRIWRAAQRSGCRDYTLWVISDHGQEDTLPYARARGESLVDAIERILERELSSESKGLREQTGVQIERARVIWRKVFGSGESSPEEEPTAESSRFHLTAMGPLGHLHFPKTVSPEERDRVASALVSEAGVPLVLCADGTSKRSARFWTAEGTGALPVNAASVLGEGHPFLEETAEELARVCHHRNAGDLVLSGWRPNGKPFSFPLENGSHAGPGPEEIGAFALLPEDTPLPREGADPLRIADLREAIRRHLGHTEHDPAPIARQRADEATSLRLATYNIHACIGMDGKALPNRIGRVLAAQRPDVVALQEVDVARPRSHGHHQAKLLAERLGMSWQFHPAAEWGGEQYGLAILSSFPMRLVKAGALPGFDRRPRLEPRAALWVEVEVNGHWVQIINVHLGLRRWERIAQCEALLGEEWLGHPECTAPVILCGDFNSPPGSRVHRRLTERCRDVQADLRGHRPLRTFTGGHRPMARIDHIFVQGDWRVDDLTVPRGDLAMMASDHLPLVADLHLVAGGVTAR